MKKILVIATHVPAFDTNAGDYRIFHLIRMLSAKHRVFFLPLRKPGREYEYYTDKLKEAGIVLLDAADMLETVNGSFDIIIFEFYHSAVKLIDLFRRNSKAKIIIDSHILKYLENERWANQPADLLEKNRSVELEVYKKADAVITVTEREKKILEEEIDAEIYCVSTALKIPDEIRGRNGRRSIVFIGYMNNMQNQEAVLFFVNDVLPLVLKKNPEIKLYVVGSSPPEEISRLESSNIRVTGYTADPTVYASSCMVSVVPLLNGGGMKQKIIESLAYGCPVVTTTVGVEGMGLVHGRDVFIADPPGNFAEYVVLLYRDEKIWYKLSLNGYKKAKDNFSMEEMERKILKVVDAQI